MNDIMIDTELPSSDFPSRTEASADSLQWSAPSGVATTAEKQLRKVLQSCSGLCSNHLVTELSKGG